MSSGESDRDSETFPGPSEIERNQQAQGDVNWMEEAGVPVLLSPNRNRTKLSTRCLSQSSAEGPSSAPQQAQPGGKIFQEYIEKNSFSMAINILRNLVYRRKNRNQYKERMTDVISKAGFDLDLIKGRWPVWAVLENIDQEIKEISRNIRGIEADEIKERLQKIREDITKFDEQCNEDLRKVKDFDKVFITEDARKEKIKEELVAIFPWLETNGPSADQQGLSAREQLKSELFDEGNNKFDVSLFPGLKEAIEKSVGQQNLPDYQKPIASGFEKAEYMSIPLVVKATTKEMKGLPLDAFDRATLLRWGAALNRARQVGFNAEDADKILWKNLHAFFAWQNI